MKKETKRLIAVEVIWLLRTIAIFAVLLAIGWFIIPSLRLDFNEQHNANNVLEWLLYLSPICTFPVRWLINLSTWAMRTLDNKENPAANE